MKEAKNNGIESDAISSQIHISSEHGIAAALEAQRLADKYGKDFFCCEDLMQILGVGMNNIRQLMSRNGFPTITIGNRKVVSSVAFVLWSLTQREV